MEKELITVFHFTNRPNVELIVKQKKINAGAHVKNKTLAQGVVSLTTDSDPRGHGLTDGREVTKEQARLLKFGTEKSGKLFCVDNTEFCLKITLPRSALQSAQEAHDQQELQALEIAGYFPCSINPSNPELAQVATAIKLGSLPGKSASWWYHLGDLQLEDYEILRKNESGTYLPLRIGPRGEVDLTSIPAQQIFACS